MEKKDAAEILFIEGYNQVEISKVLGLSEVTISKWSMQGKWKEKKIASDILQNNSIQRILRMIDYQTAAIERKYTIWLDEDKNSTKLIERGDLDALQKLFTTIKRDSKKFTDYVSVIKEFFDWLQNQNIEAAKMLSEYADEFINIKRANF